MFVALAHGSSLRHRWRLCLSDACTPSNDFFLLHGLTGAFANHQLRSVLSLADQGALARHFVRTLAAVYISRGCPALSVALEPATGATELRRQLLALEEARLKALSLLQPDEHTLKAVMVALAIAADACAEDQVSHPRLILTSSLPHPQLILVIPTSSPPHLHLILSQETAIADVAVAVAVANTALERPGEFY